MVSVYFNDHDPRCADWLLNLAADGAIGPPGGVTVDRRRVEEVNADDLRGFTECHFFAGIGGWWLALRLAGWAGPAWTASLPCQPLSSAGLGQGETDERHLWPAFRPLVAELRPAVLFGEQVGGPLGREWLAGVRADLEDLGYAVGAADLPACSVGAPHIRNRLYWVAHADEQRHEAVQRRGVGEVRRDGARRGPRDGPELGGATSRMGDSSHGAGRRPQREPESGTPESATGGPSSGDGEQRGAWDRFEVVPRRSPGGGHDWCRVEPGTFPLAHGVPGRVGQISAYGNAIVPPLAAEFVTAFMEATGG